MSPVACHKDLPAARKLRLNQHCNLTLGLILRHGLPTQQCLHAHKEALLTKQASHSCLPAVLGVSLLLEGYSLLVAIRTVTAGAAQQGLSFAEFVRRGMDPTSIAVMMEDGAACAGLVVAGQPQASCHTTCFTLCCGCRRMCTSAACIEPVPLLRRAILMCLQGHASNGGLLLKLLTKDQHSVVSTCRLCICRKFVALWQASMGMPCAFAFTFSSSFSSENKASAAMRSNGLTSTA